MRTTSRQGRRPQHQPPLWPALSRLLLLLILVGIGLLVLFFFQPEIGRLSDMRARAEKLDAEVARETIEQLRLARKSDLLKNDPEYLENIARDKLDLMKPGETIIRLDARPIPIIHSPSPASHPDSPPDPAPESTPPTQP